MNYRNLVNTAKLGPVSQSAMKMGAMGAAIGGTIAVIGNGYQVAKGTQSGAQAVSNVAKETVGTGISTAAAAATVAALGIGGLAGLAGFAAVATISKGFLDSILYCSKKESASKD
jgi:hypothetical protein